VARERECWISRRLAGDVVAVVAVAETMAVASMLVKMWQLSCWVKRPSCCHRPCVSLVGRSLQKCNPACGTRIRHNGDPLARHTCFCDVGSRHKGALDVVVEKHSVGFA
jgi:hypothetical protein